MEAKANVECIHKKHSQNRFEYAFY